MIWNDFEKSFAQAASRSLSRRKILLAFLTLSLCGLFFVFCRALALETSPWVSMSLVFLPLLLSSGLLLSLGVLLVRMYTYETKGLALSMGRLFAGSADVMMGTSYVSMPSVFLYLILWIVLGLFFLIREIPFIGPFINVVLAFAPFLLIFCSVFLCLINLCLLFFIAPAAASQTAKRFDLVKKVGLSIASQPLSALALFLVALIPAAIIGALLTLSAQMTQISFAVDGSTLATAMEWFFVMLPFCALLSPPVVFFFQFSAESYQLLQRR